MFNIDEDKVIHITRGDIAFFSVMAYENGEQYMFQPGDVVRIKVTEKKDCNVVALQKAFAVLEESEKVEIFLTENDTKIGDVISKPVDYWYEIELNPFTNPQTIIGYDEDGAKVFKLYPEGKDVEAAEVNPEDIPVVDGELSLTSIRPVQNQAVTRGLLAVKAEIALGSVHGVEVTQEEYDALSKDEKENGVYYVIDANSGDFYNGGTAGTNRTAKNTLYNNETSGLTAYNVQDAIDAVAAADKNNLKKSDVVNSVNSDDATKPLSAAKGKALKEAIDEVKTEVKTGKPLYVGSKVFVCQMEGNLYIPFSALGLTKRPDVVIASPQSFQGFVNYDFDHSGEQIRLIVIQRSAAGNTIVPIAENAHIRLGLIVY